MAASSRQVGCGCRSCPEFYEAESWERRCLTGVFAEGLAGGTPVAALLCPGKPALPGKGAARSMFDGNAQNVGEDLGGGLVRVNFTRLWV